MSCDSSCFDALSRPLRLKGHRKTKQTTFEEHQLKVGKQVEEVRCHDHNRKL